MKIKIDWGNGIVREYETCWGGSYGKVTIETKHPQEEEFFHITRENADYHTRKKETNEMREISEIMDLKQELVRIKYERDMWKEMFSESKRRMI